MCDSRAFFYNEKFEFTRRLRAFIVSLVKKTRKRFSLFLNVIRAEKGNKNGEIWFYTTSSY